MLQLIYTSAPKLLEAGKTGFGTLARSREMPQPLVSYLERISAYDRQAGVAAVFYYTTHRMGQSVFHVFSRVGDCGADYTGRTNHLAHHFVIEQGTQEAAALQRSFSPAGLMLHLLPLWRTKYTDGPGYMENVTVSPGPPATSGAWAQLTGVPQGGRWLSISPYDEGCCLSLETVGRESLCLQLLDEALGSRSGRGWGVGFSTALLSTLSLNSVPFMCLDLRQKAAGVVPPCGCPVLELNMRMPRPPMTVSAPVSAAPVAPSPAAGMAPPPMAPPPVDAPAYAPPGPAQSARPAHPARAVRTEGDSAPRNYLMFAVVIVVVAVVAFLLGRGGKDAETNEQPPQQVETHPSVKNTAPPAKQGASKPKPEPEPAPVPTDAKPTPQKSDVSVDKPTVVAPNVPTPEPEPAPVPTDAKPTPQKSDVSVDEPEEVQLNEPKTEKSDLQVAAKPEKVGDNLAFADCEVTLRWEGFRPVVELKRSLKASEVEDSVRTVHLQKDKGEPKPWVTKKSEIRTFTETLADLPENSVVKAAQERCDECAKEIEERTKSVGEVNAKITDMQKKILQYLAEFQQYKDSFSSSDLDNTERSNLPPEDEECDTDESRTSETRFVSKPHFDKILERIADSNEVSVESLEKRDISLPPDKFAEFLPMQGPLRLNYEDVKRKLENAERDYQKAQNELKETKDSEKDRLEGMYRKDFRLILTVTDISPGMIVVKQSFRKS